MNSVDDEDAPFSQIHLSSPLVPSYEGPQHPNRDIYEAIDVVWIYGQGEEMVGRTSKKRAKEKLRRFPEETSD